MNRNCNLQYEIHAVVRYLFFKNIQFYLSMPAYKHATIKVVSEHSNINNNNIGFSRSISENEQPIFRLEAFKFLAHSFFFYDTQSSFNLAKLIRLEIC